MQDSPSLPLSVPVPYPARGANTRIRLGSSDLVLESVRGGHALLWSDGRQARRYGLGLRPDGELHLQLRAPRLPVHCVPRDVLTIVPGARLRGYVHVPLVPTLTWTSPGAEPAVLLELPPNDLTAEWDEHEGHRFRCVSPWLVRFPMRSGEPRAVVPLSVHNLDDGMLSPTNLPLQLGDDDLVAMRGSVVVRPRRLQWRSGTWATGAGAEVGT
jgi:hypothetical protein